MRSRALTVWAGIDTVLSLVLKDALINWSRNLTTMGPAAATMALMLLLTGGGALGAVSLRAVAAQQAADASLLHVYLRDDAPVEEVETLRHVLSSDPRVTQVTFASKEEALRLARARPGMSELLADTADNPLPAGFDVRVRKLPDVAAISSVATASGAIDPAHPTSFDPGLYGQLQRIMSATGLIGLGVLIVLTLISAAVTANAIRAAALSRRQETRTMRLVGASRWMLIAPFMVEGALTGAAAALVAGLLMIAAQRALTAASGTNYSEILPGVSTEVTIVAAVALLPFALLLGSLSSLPALRSGRA